MRKCLLVIAVLLVAACGDKVPESKAAKAVGSAPKQTVDKAAAGVNEAMGKAAERVQDQDDKKQ
jgi:hypothetical protein